MSASASAEKAKKTPLTHFLAIPLTTASSGPQLTSAVSHFRRKLAGINELAQYANTRAVRQPGCLHLTLGVMSLNEQDLMRAWELLQKWDFKAAFRRASEERLGGRSEVDQAKTPVEPLVVSLKGLESMHAVTKTSILYIEPLDHTDRLMGICAELRKMFQDAGLMVKDDRPLKLHVTVFNLKYVPRGPAGVRGGRGAGRGVRPGRTERFANIDAFEIIRDMQDFDWAKGFALDRIAICKMGTDRILDGNGQVVDEVYEEAFTLKLDW